MTRSGTAILTHDGLPFATIIGEGRPWRSAAGDMRTSIGARCPDGRTYRGTAFANSRVRITPNPNPNPNPNH